MLEERAKVGLTVYLFKNLSQSLSPITFRDVLQCPLNTSHICSGDSVQHLSGAVQSNTLERDRAVACMETFPFIFLGIKKGVGRLKMEKMRHSLCKTYFYLRGC